MQASYGGRLPENRGHHACSKQGRTSATGEEASTGDVRTGSDAAHVEGACRPFARRRSRVRIAHARACRRRRVRFAVCDSPPHYIAPHGPRPTLARLREGGRHGASPSGACGRRVWQVRLHEGDDDSQSEFRAERSTWLLLRSPLPDSRRRRGQAGDLPSDMETRRGVTMVVRIGADCL